ncbi:MAG TPA: MFS transporter [Chitinophagales bacterium]|jgi:putative MFS transporter|nr:MFS transporter [Chitinophagales bacterium]HQW80075.1 MFS transporter [Chitinophagales bacterium]HRB18765.1 MFS transporter [Chitinophagales bacterium]HRB66762.1 MFS transporter [Chitinophagales bacterium]HRB68762.1 MFS transporter [Chitinophagales bacterium]
MSIQASTIENKNNRAVALLVMVAALGYFVDIFDLLLFGMVRISSLKDLGVNDALLESIGLRLDNWQMLGMLVGGIFWGILGDKKGRLSVLFGSILTYSIANTLNSYVQTIPQYEILRFIAGFGLAGELGAGVTLVNESLSKERRGIATAIVAGFGVFGAVFGCVIVLWLKDWRLCYLIGGIMGFALLILRISIYESGMYQNVKSKTNKLGNFSILFTDRKRFIKYISIIALAIPIWYVVQLYAKYAPELADAIGLQYPDKKQVAVYAILAIYSGLTIGDVSCGIVSNYLKSRKKALLIYICLLIVCIILFWTLGSINMTMFYVWIFILGLTIGYWAMFMSVATESFGINIRSTVSNTAPNFVRGSVIAINMLYITFKNNFHFSTQMANILVGIICISISILAWSQLEETYGKDLDYVE